MEKTPVQMLIESVEYWDIKMDCPNLFKAICNECLELEEQKHKQTYEAGKETYRQHLSYGEGLKTLQFYYNNRFKNKQ